MTERLKALVGAPDVEAIDALKNEEYTPFTDIQTVSGGITSKNSCPAPGQPLRPILSDSPEEFFRYIGAIAELIGHDIEMISARADHRKLYRNAAQY